MKKIWKINLEQNDMTDRQTERQRLKLTLQFHWKGTNNVLLHFSFIIFLIEYNFFFIKRDNAPNIGDAYWDDLFNLWLSKFNICFRVMSTFVKAELRNIGRKKRKHENEERCESSSSGVSSLMVVMVIPGTSSVYTYYSFTRY